MNGTTVVGLAVGPFLDSSALRCLVYRSTPSPLPYASEQLR
jgi:hypothetical protein